VAAPVLSRVFAQRFDCRIEATERLLGKRARGFPVSGLQRALEGIGGGECADVVGQVRDRRLYPGRDQRLGHRHCQGGGFEQVSLFEFGIGVDDGLTFGQNPRRSSVKPAANAVSAAPVASMGPPSAGAPAMASPLPIKKARRMLTRGGRIVSVKPSPANMVRSALPGPFHVVIGKFVTADLEAVARAAGDGHLRLPIAQTVRLAQAIPALTQLEQKGFAKRGKLVIVPG